MVRAWSELGSPLRSELVALAPPYRTCASISSLERGASLPLGSLVLGRGDTTIAVLAELTALSYRSPWAIPCIAVPACEEILKPLLMLVTELRDRLVLVTRGVPCHALAGWLGWEWVLEAALRTGGYVSASFGALVPDRRAPAHCVRTRRLTPVR